MQILLFAVKERWREIETERWRLRFEHFGEIIRDREIETERCRLSQYSGFSKNPEYWLFQYSGFSKNPEYWLSQYSGFVTNPEYWLSQYSGFSKKGFKSP